jgi:FkbM family methyltransferase
MAKIQSDLIYDIGLFDGDDTAYYLHQGYRVVSVDANPNMIENGKKRFAKELQAGRLTLLNYAISPTSGVVRFNVSDVPEWSSVHVSIASRNGTKFREVEVPTARIDSIFEQHGLPYYLKIDIEGNDRLVLMGLTPELRPKFVSAESECQGDRPELTDEEAIENLDLMKKAGYTKFKMIRQSDFTAERTSGAGTFVKRLAISMTHGRLKKLPMLATVGGPFSDRALVDRIGYDFKSGSSGPWGEQLPGEWMDYDTARRVYLDGRRAYFAQPDKPAAFSYWFDWHATY